MKQTKEQEIDRALDIALKRSRFIGYSKGYDDGKAQALKQVMEIIDKIEVKPEDNSVTRFTPYIYSEELKEELENLDSVNLVTGKKVGMSALSVKSAELEKLK